MKKCFLKKMVFMVLLIPMVARGMEKEIGIPEKKENPLSPCTKVLTNSEGKKVVVFGGKFCGRGAEWISLEGAKKIKETLKDSTGGVLSSLFGGGKETPRVLINTMEVPILDKELIKERGELVLHLRKFLEKAKSVKWEVREYLFNKIKDPFGNSSVFLNLQNLGCQSIDADRQTVENFTDGVYEEFEEQLALVAGEVKCELYDCLPQNNTVVAGKTLLRNCLEDDLKERIFSGLPCLFYANALGVKMENDLIEKITPSSKELLSVRLKKNFDELESVVKKSLENESSCQDKEKAIYETYRKKINELTNKMSSNYPFRDDTSELFGCLAIGAAGVSLVYKTGYRPGFLDAVFLFGKTYPFERAHGALYGFLLSQLKKLVGDLNFDKITEYVCLEVERLGLICSLCMFDCFVRDMNTKRLVAFSDPVGARRFVEDLTKLGYKIDLAKELNIEEDIALVTK